MRISDWSSDVCSSDLAAPRNDPASWVTDSDYRSRWIREGLQGTAKFRLEIAASGKVSGCTITQSTGHAVLDQVLALQPLVEVMRRAPVRGLRDEIGRAHV